MSYFRSMPPVQHRFKPGSCPNPGGKPKIPDHLRGISRLSQPELAATVAKYARMSKTEISAAATSPDIPMIELAIASVFVNAAKHGDYQRLAFLLDRAIGKPLVAVPEPPAEDDVAGLSDAELIARVRESIDKAG